MALEDAKMAIQENAPFAKQNDSQRDLDKAEHIEECNKRVYISK